MFSYDNELPDEIVDCLGGIYNADLPGFDAERDAVVAEMCWPKAYHVDGRARRVRVLTATWDVRVEPDVNNNPADFVVHARPVDAAYAGFEFTVTAAELDDVGRQLRAVPELRNLNW